ncbi:bifunctional adenosylcobinamide kinase/adenosylcobinamide-phosphate guanylyltransferase [Mycolicibacterium litorale]|uniref:Adenosylcobinamide kinase n=1 Tax=Mycolicibacterium litorale TaxID=758802 RepID=A0AAD1IKR5_9MYCO|nr:bifunctional adenosylcobinamide kinase/adenosylcobinamide-phosphate guanylyltransferase [Mycolicibacterium litorale]MCV7414435.1 bifunctional adenosylcobinamide kinase/adenosylcobinamide-phosphate guanylyltransferase [Mycolicibacterium litorale]TDY01420.1 adenosylcobinamide kinase /adenosylcobinamide-phosphate guanylyltransferase [Mycolicibacterium litorale]BBY15367.1 adenosylcobinamide kinase [Mycolicibacterium litorale]
MRTLVLGGIRSGKSQWAEAEIAAAGAVRYVATGAPPGGDDEWSRRVAAHRARRPGDWVTAETTDVPGALRSGPALPTLVDDIGGWLTAEMDRCGAWTGGSVSGSVDDLVAAVDAFTAPLALVSPEVGLTVVPGTAAGRRFADELGVLNQRLAATCERVVLIVAGQPISVKEPS